MKGLIFDIRRYCVHDGPGIRTTVFFKGCPLDCLWCHNPESRSAEIQQFPFERKLGESVFQELETIGRVVDTEELIREILKDLVFYDESGGGVTFSGGEPLQQPGFLMEIARACKAKGIHTALDTSGYASQKDLELVMPFIDLYLYDIKGIDPEQHTAHTGKENAQILQNLRFLFGQGRKVIIRFPVMPGLNDSGNNLLDMMHFLRNNPSDFREIHLLPYHSIHKNKYEKLGMKYQFKELPEPDRDKLLELKAGFESVGFRVKIGG